MRLPRTGRGYRGSEPRQLVGVVVDSGGDLKPDVGGAVGARELELPAARVGVCDREIPFVSGTIKG
jgi:hypothetical protein